MRIRFFLASSTPLRIDSGTSPALPRPTPTWPWPSPTTTTALKLNRRPPLTTLATRLIWTTRSSSVRRPGSILGNGFSLFELEVEPALARGVSQRANTAVITEAGSIEDDSLDTCRTRALGKQPADHLGLLRLGALRGAHARLERRGSGKGLAGSVVDDLGVDLIEAAEDREPRPLRRPGHGQANAVVTLLACSVSPDRCGAHFLPPILPALPALRRICSPA